MKKKMLLIACDYYKNLRMLKCAVKDADAVEAKMCEKYGFSKNEIVKMTASSEENSNGDLYPKQQNIVKQLMEMIPERLEDRLDLLIVGFWGHGFHTGGKRFLCDPYSRDSARDLKLTALPMELFLGCIRHINAAATVLILDCCQDEPNARGGASSCFVETEIEAFADKEGQKKAFDEYTRDVGCKKSWDVINPTMAILNSCSVGGRAYELEKYGHGAFTYFLLDGLNAGLDTAGKLFSFVQKQMREKKEKFDNAWCDQSPYLSLEGADASLILESGAASDETLWNEVRSLRSMMDKMQNELELLKSARGGVARTPQPSRTLRIYGCDFRFRWIPPGSFQMGSVRNAAEQPIHQVTITRGFWLLETPVTQCMWYSIMPNPNDKPKDNFPMVNVSWLDVDKFIQKLNGLQFRGGANGGNLDFKFRLPTEAEWEYACRAGEDYKYSGSDDLDSVGWYGEKWQSGPREVGLKKPNAWGLKDMCGNVWELCQDWFGDYDSNPTRDPQGTDPGRRRLRVNRGGSFDSIAQKCSCSFRYGNVPGFSRGNLGFRFGFEVRCTPSNTQD